MGTQICNYVVHHIFGSKVLNLTQPLINTNRSDKVEDTFYLYLTNHHEPNDGYGNPHCALVKTDVKLGAKKYTIPSGGIGDCVAGR